MTNFVFPHWFRGTFRDLQALGEAVTAAAAELADIPPVKNPKDKKQVTARDAQVCYDVLVVFFFLKFAGKQVAVRIFDMFLVCAQKVDVKVFKTYYLCVWGIHI